MKRWVVFLAVVALGGCASSAGSSSGDDRFRANDFDGAIEAYEAALAKDPANADLNLKLAAAKRNSAVVHQGRAETALEAGDLDRAHSEVKIALARDSNNEAAHSTCRKIRAIQLEVTDQISRARGLMQNGENQNAYKILESISKYRAAYPEMTILSEQVADRYVRDLLQAAQILGRAGDWTKAYAILDHATEVALKVPVLQPTIKSTQVDVRVMELMDQGLKLKSQDDLAGALNRFETAYKLKPESPEVIEAYSSTRHSVALTYVTRAGEASEAAQPLLAYVWLRKAMEIEPDSKELGEIKSNIVRAASHEMVLRSEAAFRKGHVGLEWLRLKEAQAIDPEYPQIDKMVRDTSARLDKAIRPTILVEKFQNASAYPGHEIRLASEAYRQLQSIASNGKLATILDEGAMRLHKQENDNFVPDIVVRGTLERFDIVHHPDTVQNEVKEYFAERSYYDVFTSKETRVTEKQYYNYNIVTKKVSAVGTLVYEIYDTENKTPLGKGTLEENFVKEDKVVQGNKQAGVAEDPLELPPDEEIANQLHNALKDRLLNGIQSDLSWTGKKLYAMYLKAKEGEDVDAALSYAVLAAKSLSACGRESLPQDLDFVLKKTGYSLKDDKLQVDSIK